MTVHSIRNCMLAQIFTVLIMATIRSSVMIVPKGNKFVVVVYAASDKSERKHIVDCMLFY